MLGPPGRLRMLAGLTQIGPPPSRFSTQELVDLLKVLTCVGSAREVILQQLGQRYNHHLGDQWDFVDYAHEHLPDIDLKSPPKRP